MDTGTWTFTDDRGETVEVEGDVRPIVAFSGLAAALHDYGVAVDAVFGPTVLADGSPDPMAGRLPVDEIQILGNTFGEFDIEAFAALGPKLVVSQHYEGFPLWYVPDDVIDEVEALAPTVGVQISGRDLDEFLDARSGNLQAADLVDYPTWNAISAVAAGQIFAWNSEPVYSHTGAAELLEAMAQAITDARSVTV